MQGPGWKREEAPSSSVVERARKQGGYEKRTQGGCLLAEGSRDGSFSGGISPAMLVLRVMLAILVGLPVMASLCEDTYTVQSAGAG